MLSENEKSNRKFNSNKIKSILLIFVLTICFWTFGPGVYASPDVDTFSDDSPEAIIQFPVGGGTNTQITMTLDEGEKVHDFSMKISSHPLNGSYPSDITFNIGSSSKVEWQYPGQLVGNTTIEGNDIISTLNNELIPETGNGKTPPITLNITSTTAGNLTLRGLSVFYNKIPEVTDKVVGGKIPTQVLEEGGSASYMGLDLHKYFSDPDGDELGYVIRNNDMVHYLMDNSTGLVTFFSEENYYGMETLEISAVDHLGTSVSAQVTVNIRSVTDDILIIASHPADSVVYIPEGEGLSFSLEVENIDDVVVSYSWEMDGDEIPNEDGWNYTYSPKFRDQGSRSLKVLVKSGSRAYVRGWTIVVDNVNQPPNAVLKNPRPLGPGEGSYSSDREINLSALGSSDNDGNIISYRWVSDLDGLISTSLNDMIKLSGGTHNITLLVMDNDGTVDEKFTKIEVESAGSGKQDKKEEDKNWVLTIIILSIVFAVIIIIMVALMVIMKKRASSPYDKTKGGKADTSGETPDTALSGKRLEPKKEPSRRITVNNTVKCEVCNRDFMASKNAYMCKICDSLLHLECEIPVCPNCGSDTSSCLSSVEVEKLERTEKKDKLTGEDSGWVSVKDASDSYSAPVPNLNIPIDSPPADEPSIADDDGEWEIDESDHDIPNGTVSGLEKKWQFIPSLEKANICFHCSRMMKIGEEGNQCPDCSKVYHIECMFDLDSCKNCGFS